MEHKNRKKERVKVRKAGRRRGEKRRCEARKRLRLIGEEEERELRNNIHKSINMCLTYEQPIGSIYFVFFRMSVVRDNYPEVSAISSGSQKINRSTQNIIL